MSGLLCLTWNNHYSSFLKLLSSLHLKDLYCDATIACHGKYYPVHRLVLSTCSEYFEEIFGQTKCKHPYIIVKDVKPDELEALLNYMYKGEVNVSQELLPELITAAESLKIKGLAVPDDATDKPTSNAEKKRSNTMPTSSSQSKKKRLFEEKKRENVCTGNEDSEYSKELGLDSDSGKGISKRQQEGSEDILRTTTKSSHSDERIDLQGIKVEDSPVESNTNGAEAAEKQLHEVKVEAEEVSDFSEQFMFPPGESGLGQESSFSSSFVSVGTFNSSEVNKELPEANQYESQTIWARSTDDSGGKELQAPLEIDDGLPAVADRMQYEAGVGSNALTSDNNNSFENPSSIEVPFLPSSSVISRSSDIRGSFKDTIEKCLYCPVECTTKLEMKKHLFEIHKIHHLSCNFCSYLCSSKAALRSHMRRHTGERPFPCHLCPYKAAQKISLQRHVTRLHTGEKPFTCSYCPFRCSQRYYMKTHMKLHADSRLLICSFCTYRSYRKDYFDIHMQKHV